MQKVCMEGEGRVEILRCWLIIIYEIFPGWKCALKIIEAVLILSESRECWGFSHH